MVGLLARRGADVSAGDKWGASPLHRACLEGHLAAARAVLDAGYERVRRVYGLMGWVEVWCGRGQGSPYPLTPDAFFCLNFV